MKVELAKFNQNSKFMYMWSFGGMKNIQAIVNFKLTWCRIAWVIDEVAAAVILAFNLFTELTFKVSKWVMSDEQGGHGIGP